MQKLTSFEYSDSYQQSLLDKYLNRSRDHWSIRVDLCDALFDDWFSNIDSTNALSVDQDFETISVLDVGCSIGTFALEFAKRGFKSAGVDFDEAAIKIARSLAKDQGLDVTFHCCDVSALSEKI